MLFKQVVDVLDLEFQLHLGVVVDLAGVLEVADAGAEQHHALQGQAGLVALCRGRLLVGLLGISGQDTNATARRRRHTTGNLSTNST